MTLSKVKLKERLNCKDIAEAIVVTPILDRNNQIGPCGIDVRLGKQFIVFNEDIQDVFSFDIEKGENINVYQDEIVLAIGSPIIIHPGKVIIASTLEYVSIPDDLECQVEGRSSWARLGLVIATASTIEAGFKGVITLELSNIGKIPITLYPGLRIAQLIFHTIDRRSSNDNNQTEEDNTSKYEKKYIHNIGPKSSKILNDKDASYFIRKQK